MQPPAGNEMDFGRPADAGSLTEGEQNALMKKVTRRLIPLLFLCYIIAYIDRINVGFAKLHLREVLGVEPKDYDAVFGLGAGLFFIGYFLFEVPSNLILHRVGARIWIARIMVVWGLVSMSFMFVKGVTMFYVMRFLLGAAEAGFFPGVILYLTYWYPPKERAGTIALFILGGIAAGVIGSPISGAILDGMHQVLGMPGWKWLFFLEALPAVIFGIVVLCVLPNGPDSAKWLSDREKKWVKQRVAQGSEEAGPSQTHSLAGVFKSGKVWVFCLLYFLMNVGGYGYEMWLPTIVKKFSGQSDSTVGLLNAIPYFVAGVAMFLVGRNSDRTGERRAHVGLSAFTAAVGFALAAYFTNPYLAMAGLTIAFAGLKSTIAPFWAMTTAFLTGAGAAGGIALINSVGNLGGFFGPYLVGYIKKHTDGSNVAALSLLGCSLLAMGLIAFMVPKPKRQA
ncbi:MAG: MFS transporter [Verrucomicrobiota bacterium]|nr:MFS transporter [Verrucomicrobiota bacterium]